LFASTPVFATDFRSQSTDFTGSAEQVLTNELWLMASTITLPGQAMDDLLLFAEASTGVATNVPSTIRIGGQAHGSVWAVGESIEISGVIARHARLLGYRLIEVSGRIERNLIAVGSTISLPPTATVTGDALLVGREVVVEGSVAGNTRIYAESVTLAGRLTGDVTMAAATITVMPGTHIGGNLHYRMDQDLILDSDVSLGGKLIRETLPPPTPRTLSAGDYVLQLALCMAAIMVGLVFALLFPGIAGLSLQRMMDSFWKCLLIGFVAFCLIPMTAFMLLLTLVGLPLSLLTVLAYIILIYLGKVVAALYLGHWILFRRTKPPALRLFPVLTLGLVTIYTAALLPFPIDILVWFTFTLLGMGAIVGAILDRRTAVLVAYPGEQPPSAPPPLPGTLP
jgi:cytoskeletal protein CcmA (bactofilin family)